MGRTGNAVRRLWTVQRREILAAVRQGLPHVPSWEETAGSFHAAYRFMAARLREATGGNQENPPVWAWRRNDVHAPINREFIGSLLSEHEMTRKNVVVSLSVPSRLALESDYGVWNDVLDRFSSGEAAAAKTATTWTKALFRVKRGSLTQVCLPCIHPAWVDRVWELNLASGQEEGMLKPLSFP